MQTRDSTGDYLFSAVSPGEYSLCFLNTEGAEKSVYFDATAETDTEGKGPGTELRTMPGSAGAQKAELRQTVVPMEATIQKLYDSLASVQRQQRYFHTRENRNLSTGMVLLNGTLSSTASELYHLLTY